MLYKRVITGGLLALSGCAGVDAQKSSPDAAAQAATADKPTAKSVASTPAAELQRRKKMVAQEFDSQRDRAQYQAAMGRWQQDDVAGCRQALAILLARNPDHREGHLLAAQVDLSDNKPKAALEHARHVLVAFPNDAEAHYEAALALDAMGQMADALPHYEQAARLAPDEDAYRASYQAAIGTAILPPGGSGVPANPSVANDRIDRAAHVASAAYYNESDSDDHGEQALEPLRNLAKAHPDDQQAALDACACALRVGQPQAAVEVATASLSAGPILRRYCECWEWPNASAAITAVRRPVWAGPSRWTSPTHWPTF